MVDKVELDKAMAAHGAWKTRLRSAIDEGRLEIPVATICKDDQCAFGQWLYGGTLTPAEKDSQHYKSVRQLHAQFHQVAGSVAQLALDGNKPQAEQKMSMGGDFAAISARLINALMEWKRVA